MVGLFFFIRASTKDRTETLDLVAPEAPELTMQALTRYFQGRAYQLQSVEPMEASLQFTGMVRPSWFLAGFLTVLAAVGCLCLALVLASLFPQNGLLFLGLIWLAPAAGWFYWQRAGREEHIRLTLRSDVGADSSASQVLQITAHRDELIALQQAWTKDRLAHLGDNRAP